MKNRMLTLTILIISLCTLCTQAQYVEVNCTDCSNIGTNEVKLCCDYYTIEYTEINYEREVVILKPDNIQADSVIEITLNHPSLPFFVNETFVAFPNLRILLIYGSLITMQPYAFSSAQNLEALTIIADPLLALPAYAFTGATKLKSMIFFACSSIIQFDGDAFVGLDSLDTLTFQGTPLASPPLNLFKPLINLKNIALWDTDIEVVHAELFTNNFKLEGISIFDEVNAVDRTFMDGLPNLSYVYIGGSCVDAGVTFDSSDPSRPLIQFQSAMQMCYSNYDDMEW